MRACVCGDSEREKQLPNILHGGTYDKHHFMSEEEWVQIKLNDLGRLNLETEFLVTV